MASKSKQVADGSNKVKLQDSAWKRALVANAEWPDKVRLGNHETSLKFC